MRNLLKKRRYGSRGQVGYSVLNQVYDNVRANLKGLAAVLKGTLLDLSSNLGGYSKWVFDRSFKSNHATLKTGIYAIANGASDSLINANCSALGSAYYRLRASIRSSLNGSKVAQVASTAAGEVAFTVTNAGVWEEVVSTPTASAVVPSLVRVGQANPGAPVYSNLDCSDVRLERSTNGVDGWTEVSRWQLNDSEAADLDGHFVADVSGNGYHGAHVGGSSGSGEGMDPVLAKLDGGLLWFDGVDTSLDYGSPLFPATADFDETFWWYIAESAAPVSNLYALEQATSATPFFGLSLTSGGNIALVGGSGAAIDMILTSATPYYQTLVKVRITKTSGTLELYLNDVSIGTYGTAYSIQQVNTQWGRSSFLSGGRHITGLIYGDNVSGTQSGSFITLATKRATILQTAGLNWNIGYGKIAETIYEFSANVQNFVSDAGDPVLAAAQSIGGENDAMQATYTAKNYFYRNATTVFGKKYQILFDVYVPSSNTTLTAVRGRINFTGSQYTPYSTLQDQWETVEGLIANDEVTGLPARLYFYVNTYTTGDVVYIRNIVIREVASTSLFLIPASPTDTTVDIFGNPIDNPRLNGKVVNLASSNLSAQVAADASMDATQTVYGWVYYDGTDGNFFDLGAPTIGATAGVLTSTLAGTLTYSVNGVATNALGTAGWKLIGIASTAPQGTDAIDLLRTCAALRFSERELTAAEIADIYNAEKSQYII